MRFALLSCLFAASVLSACANPAPDDAGVLDASTLDAEVAMDASVDDAGFAPVDAGFRLLGVSLTPAASAGTTATHRLQGALRPTQTVTATTPTHRLRGGLTPLGH